MQPSHRIREEVAAREIANFSVLAIDKDWRFTIEIGSLSPLRDYLRDGSDGFEFSQFFRVGKLKDGSCSNMSERSRGFWSFAPSQFVNGEIVQLNPDAKYNDGRPFWQVGDKPCVRRTVTWVWPEEMEFLGGLFDFDEHVHPSKAESRARSTPNTIPRKPLVASAPIDGFADVEAVLPDPFQGDSDLENYDPDAIDAPEIVLPDFFSDDESSNPIDTLLGEVPDNAAFDTAAVRRAAQDLRTQFIDLARLLGVNATNNQGQGMGNAPQREAIISAARNPQNLASAIARARAAISTIQQATSNSSDPAAAQVVGQLDTYSRQLDNFANAAPVSVAGGVAPASKVDAAVGFNATQSPVAGLNGTGSLAGLTMKVQGPKTAKSGKKAAVRVTVSPRTATGIVRLAILRNTSAGLKVIAAKQLKLRNGKAGTTVTISRNAAKGAYTLMASLVPNTRSGSGITVQRPITVN